VNNLTKYIVTVFISLIIFSGCSVKDYTLFSHNQERVPQIDQNLSLKEVYRYKIKPHDRLSVMFYSHPELSTRVVGSLRRDEIGILVNSKGIATFPLVGDLNMSDTYQEDAGKMLETAYAEFIVEPHLNLEVINKRIVVLGEVKNPGTVEIQNETMNLFEVMSRSGGLTKTGKRSGVIVLRGDLNNPEMMSIDLTDMESILGHNLTLLPNDIVYISPNVNIMIEQAIPSATIVRMIADVAVSAKIVGLF